MQECDLILVRHCVAAKRGDFDRIRPLIHPGFDSPSSMSSSGGDAFSMTTPCDRWTVTLQWSRSDWVPVYSNTASSQDLYAANCESRRSQVLWIRRDKSGDRELKWSSARNVVVEFSHSASDPDHWKTYRCFDDRVERLLQDAIGHGLSGEEAFTKLCEHAEVVLPFPTLRIVESKYSLIGSAGRSLGDEIGGFVCFNAFGMASGSSPASDGLLEAIEAGDPKGIQKAIADGASLVKVPDSSCSPLEKAMYQFGKTAKWRQCVQALIDAGCSFSEGTGESPIFTATSHIVPESMSIELLKVLLENGVDINQRNGAGQTVLHLSAVYRRLEVVRFLVDHGARVDLKTKGDETIVDDIRGRVDESAKYGKRSEYADILEILTGVPYELPEEYKLSDGVVAESKRFIQVANAKQLRSQLPELPEVQQIKISRLGRFGRFNDYVRQLKKCGFEEACHLVVRVAMPVMQTVYTHDTLQFDAVLGDDGPLGDGRLRLEICAYTVDGQILTVSNKPAEEMGDFRAPIIESHLIEDATAAALIDRLKEIVSTRQIHAIDRRTAVDRYRDALTRILGSIKDRTKEIERKQWTRRDGAVPRFERLRIYLQVRPGSEPADCSTTNISRSCLESVDDYRRGKLKNRDECGVIRRVAELMAVGHLEFAGASPDAAAVDVGIDAALKFFGGQKKKRGEPTSVIEPLTFALAIMSVHGRWGEMKTLSESLTDSLFDPKARDYGDPPIAYAELMGMIANLFRKKSLVDSAELYNRIERVGDKRAHALATAVMAIGESDSAGFGNAFIEAIKLASKQKQRRDWFFDLERVVAWFETSIWQIAKSRDLPLPALKPSWSDWLIMQGMDQASQQFGAD